MNKNTTAFPTIPGVIREQAILKKAAIVYLSCKPCECLGWKKNCPGKDKCGVYFYSQLEKHFLELQNAKSTESTRRPF